MCKNGKMENFSVEGSPSDGSGNLNCENKYISLKKLK